VSQAGYGPADDSNISKGYAAEAGNGDITILPNDVAGWPEPINHDRAELVKAGPERYRNRE